VSASRDAEFTEYASARLPVLRRLAMVLCHDWQRADDLVQAAITKLYLHWDKARAADHVDAYAKAVLVREFVHEQRSGRVKRVSLTGGMADRPAGGVDHDAVLDLRGAVAALPPRQRATLVLRFYCDLNVALAAGSGEFRPNIPFLGTDPATSHSSCHFYPNGQSTRRVIDGYKVVVNHWPGEQQLCAAHAHGLAVFIAEIGGHPAISVIALFEHHLRLLGANPANWTKAPIG
jgi:DNA-directed RNA polymerase specialized sigma24 family protein